MSHPDENKKSIPVPVRNFCLVKRIVDCDNGLDLVGTIRQTIENPKDNTFFQYRFNDLTAVVGGEMIQERTTDNDNIQESTSSIDTKDTKQHTMTYNVKAPLVFDVVNDLFPFKIVQASLTMELSKRKCTDSNQMLHPNIKVAKENKTDNISLQRPKMKEGEKEDKKIAALKDKMDAMKKFDLITPFPQVEYICEEKGKKKYCAKLKMTFFLAEEGISKVIEVIAPMLLIATLNTLHVLSDDVDANEYIANSATLALTAVFLLSSIKDESNRTRWFTANNFYISLVFIGLTFSSFPEDMIGTKNVALTGMVFFWLSFLVPLVNTLKYLFCPLWGCKQGELSDFLQLPVGEKERNVSFVSVTELVEGDKKGDQKLLNRSYKMKPGEENTIIYA
eukprot:CAMPEP_0185724662 /NCGR_PEP_ID=MMETSP1171-20130828/1077_1 /TAXON_ID=374046 /ORGANISM="Helicotheca tamensis, Strain CCMP826" /LENGTH=391 /DNA_ID=CAMNT_0028392561 /DNA_START=105 /DNA_END=1280 /DNA_ORIENTATION=-